MLDSKDTNKYENAFMDVNNEEVKKLFAELSDIWKASVQGEIVANEGTSVQNTPDGDIKVTKLVLQLNDERAKNILKKLINSVYKNNYIKETVITNAKKYADNKVDKDKMVKNINNWFDTLPQEIEKSYPKFKLDNLKLTVKLDKDLFIIDEVLEGVLIIKSEGELKINFSISNKRWNINKELKIEIPKIDNKDIMNINDIDFKNSEILKNIKKEFDK